MFSVPRPSGLRTLPSLSLFVTPLLALALAGPALAQKERSDIAISDEEVIERFTEVFGKHPTVQANKWLGIPTMQNPIDVWVTQEIIHEVQPDFLIETGTFQGGSALIWAGVMEQIKPKSKVITIDIRNLSKQARKKPLARRMVEFIIGSSTDEEIVAKIAERTKGKRVLVLLDSNHTKEHVLRELELYAPMVSVGSYVIVQDTGGVLTNEPNPGPMQALDVFMRGNNEFFVDRSRERMLLTMHPKGYLRRVR